MSSIRVMAILSVAVLAAFAANAQTEAAPPAEVPAAEAAQATPSPAPAPLAGPDLSGYWDFQVNVGERVTTGEMTLGRSGDAYLGTLTPKGTNTLAVRSLKLDGKKIDMTVESREGDVTFQGTLGEDGVSMSGTVTYHHGETFPMTARKRQAAPSAP